MTYSKNEDHCSALYHELRKIIDLPDECSGLDLYIRPNEIPVVTIYQEVWRKGELEEVAHKFELKIKTEDQKNEDRH